MTLNQAEHIKSQIKNMLSVKEILDFYVGTQDRNRRYKCPFNLSEHNNNLSIKHEHLCRCFSCSESWDEIDFVRKLFNYSTFSEALERIAIDFNLDMKEEIDEETVKRINEMKRKKEEKRKKQKEKEDLIRDICNKIGKRQGELEIVIKKHSPHNVNKLSIYAYTIHPDYVIMAQKQYEKNAMLLDVLLESDTDEKTDFIYGLAPFREHKAIRLNQTLDMIKEGVIKINDKGDVLYG